MANSLAVKDIIHASWATRLRIRTISNEDKWDTTMWIVGQIGHSTNELAMGHLLASNLSQLLTILGAENKLVCS